MKFTTKLARLAAAARVLDHPVFRCLHRGVPRKHADRCDQCVNHIFADFEQWEAEVTPA